MSANETLRDSADDEALRREIQAAIKAGRELDPEMDTHLADSVLDRYRQEQTARNKALGRPQTPAAPQVARAPGMLARSGMGAGEIIMRTVLGVAVIAAFSAMLFFHFWAFFWLIFLLPGLLGGRWGRGHHHGPRDSRRYMRIERMRSELGQSESGGTIHYD